MPPTADEGRTRSIPHTPVPTVDRDPTGRDARLRQLGAELARALRRVPEAPSALPRALRTIARGAQDAAGDDHDVHRILVDVAVAAQHLADPRALRAYARASSGAAGRPRRSPARRGAARGDRPVGLTAAGRVAHGCGPRRRPLGDVPSNGRPSAAARPSAVGRTPCIRRPSTGS